MTFDLAELQVVLWQGFVVFVRMGAMVFFLPGFAESYVPARVKLGIAFAITAIVTPLIWDQLPSYPSSQSAATFQLLSEAGVGIFWGFIIRLTLFALQIAGTIMSQSTSLAQIFGGTANTDAQPAMAHLLAVSGVALLSIFGFHVIYLDYILNTYALLPPGEILASGAASILSSGQVTRTFALAFQLSAAFLVASLLYNIVLGVINRAMPQLMVSFVGAPAITAGGILLLLIMTPTIYEVWLGFVDALVAQPNEFQQ